MTPLSARLPPGIIPVYRGERMACFDLLERGIETGWLPQVAPAPADTLPPHIPPRIAQYWHKPEPPEEVRIAIESVLAHNPGLKHNLACDETARAFIHAQHGAAGTRLFDACFHPTMRSDFWRICDLYEHGGVYVDVDTLAHAPIARIAAGAAFDCLLTYSIGAPWCIDNDFIMATPRHPMIGAILDGVFGNVDRFIRERQFENVWVETGPGITTVATMRWFAAQAIDAEIDPAHSGVVFRHHHAVAEAFHTPDMAYKKTAEGNWRMVRPVFR